MYVQLQTRPAPAVTLCRSGALDMDTPAVLRAGPDDVDSLVTRLEQHGPASAKVGGRESARLEISILFLLKMLKCVLIAISKHNSRATNSCLKGRTIA